MTVCVQRTASWTVHIRLQISAESGVQTARGGEWVTTLQTPVLCECVQCLGTPLGARCATIGRGTTHAMNTGKAMAEVKTVVSLWWLLLPHIELIRHSKEPSNGSRHNCKRLGQLWPASLRTARKKPIPFFCASLESCIS